MAINKKLHRLICYDIADARRLRQLAKELDKTAIRIQYSVFFMPSASQEELFDIMETVDEIIDHVEDDVRIYTVLGVDIRLGQAIDLSDPAIVS